MCRLNATVPSLGALGVAGPVVRQLLAGLAALTRRHPRPVLRTVKGRVVLRPRAPVQVPQKVW